MADSPELLEAERTRTAGESKPAAAATIVYQIEVILAPSPAYPKWCTVHADCFRDRRTGANLLRSTDAETAALVDRGHPARVVRDSFAFHVAEPALRLAAILNTHAAWESEFGPEPWRRPERPVVARVVEVRTAETRRVVATTEEAATRPPTIATLSHRPERSS